MNVIQQIAPKYWLVRNRENADQVTGVIVWLENGCYIPYVDNLATVAFANRDAVIEYVGVLDAPVGRHAGTQKLDAVGATVSDAIA